MKDFLTAIIVGVLFIGCCWNLHAQSVSHLEKILIKELPNNPEIDGRWVFCPKNSTIEKIEKPSVKSRIPVYNFYKVNLINYLGYHVNESMCVILHNTLNDKIILVEPLWYNGINTQLIQLFIGEKFRDIDSILVFISEIHQLMEIGSVFTFNKKSSDENSIIYDLAYSKNSFYTVGDSMSRSTINYHDDGVWRKVTIDLNKLQLVRYTSRNPITNKVTTVE